MATSQDKRNKLIRLYRDAQAAGQSLYDSLDSHLKNTQEAVGDGRVLNSTSEGGGSVGFAILSGHSPHDADAVAGHLVELYDKAVTAIGSNPTDAQIYAWMMSRLKARRQYQNDFSGLRWGVSG